MWLNFYKPRVTRIYVTLTFVFCKTTDKFVEFEYILLEIRKRKKVTLPLNVRIKNIKY